jgi:antitoxin (DNA-binding transcriptional repressor) of toxin-antitoxin stability system
MRKALDSRHPIEVRNSIGKGLGIFAISDIPRGTRVIAEAALVKIGRNRGDARNILQAFESLPTSKQNSYLKLHGFACAEFRRAAENEMGQSWQTMPELQRRVFSIFVANAFGDVFLLGFRINHSCIPNIHFAYNSNLEKETFHSVREISAGEELTVTYNDEPIVRRIRGKPNWIGRVLLVLAPHVRQAQKEGKERRRVLSCSASIKDSHST